MMEWSGKPAGDKDQMPGRVEIFMDSKISTSGQAQSSGHQEQSSDQVSLPASFVSGYRPVAGAYDEIMDDSRALRAHWHLFVTLLDDLGPEELTRRWQHASRIIHENGVTYNVYGDARGMDRPWNLDTIPLLISSSDWSHLERGLQQRARLMNLVTQDIYGPQSLISMGLIPPELVLANPRFLRPCHGMHAPQDIWLHVCSSDLSRLPSGQMCVVADRTQSPSGAGYALENRIVLSRTLPDVFRDCHVARLAPYFQSMRQMLTGLAPRNRDNPRIVLLTPGPYNETYFEHAYLARYLGYTLVQGADMTVRDHRVFLKTLSGLQPVDVILRRVDDEYCDPLELRQDSFLGLPGLIECIRQGNVAVANMPGSAVMQTPAFMPYLPSLCRQLLGEDLITPSVQTWWCGDADSRRYVLEHLDELVIKEAFPTIDHDPLFGDRLSYEQKQKLAARIASQGHLYVGQERLPLSTTPILAGARLEPRHMVLRTYLSANASGDGYTMMPGGLSRFGASPHTLVVSMQRGGGSKDTWVLSDRPVAEFSLLQSAASPVELTRVGGDLPSRVADNLYWLGRYIERCEAIVRLSRGVLLRIADQPTSGTTPELPPLVRALSKRPLDASLFVTEPENLAGRAEHELLQTLFSPASVDGLWQTLTSLQNTASMVRDRISLDTWRIIKSMDPETLRPFSPSAPHQLTSVLELLNKLILSLAAFGGMAMDSMSRGQAWRFVDMGRRIERAVQIAWLLRACAIEGPNVVSSVLEAELDVADSSMTYRRRYLTRLQLAPVVDLLLADEGNPRSVAFQLSAILEHFENLPHDVMHPRRNLPDLRAREAISMIRLADVQALCTEMADSGRLKLDLFLEELGTILPELSDLISRMYFSHSEVSLHLGGPQTESIL